MTKTYLIFNGDTDGICAAHQYYLSFPDDYIPVTGVKRDNSLLKKVPETDAELIVFDIAIEKNLEALTSFLAAGNKVRWFDHHVSKEIPEADHFTPHIDTGSTVNTAYLVAQYIGTYSPWTIMGLCGDNVFSTAEKLVSELKLTAADYELLKEAGELINYNGYGEITDDLHLHPADILDRMKPYSDAFAFLEETEVIALLRNGMKDDFLMAEAIKPIDTGIYQFPDEKWARRVIGVFANRKANEEPDQAHVVLVEKQEGEAYVASVRAPLNSDKSAAEFCQQFPTGGGRVKAAGINELRKEQLSEFVDRFRAFF